MQLISKEDYSEAFTKINSVLNNEEQCRKIIDKIMRENKMRFCVEDMKSGINTILSRM